MQKEKRTIQFPKHKALEQDPNVVVCEISNRYLRFNNTYQVMADGKKFVFANLMTVNDSGEHKKICQLCFDLNKLAEIIDSREEKK